MAEQIKQRMTVDEFRQLPESSQTTQLINGELIVSPSPKFYHQTIAGNIYFFIRQNVQNGSTLFAPMDVYIDEINSFQPDVFWLAENSQCELRDDGYYYGAPELVVEVLSPSTAKYDRQQKYTAYEQHDVHEYWIVDPVNETLEVWMLTDDTFGDYAVYDANDTFTSATLKIEIELKTMFDKKI